MKRVRVSVRSTARVRRSGKVHVTTTVRCGNKVRTKSKTY